jgi:hypothetical protein
MKRIEKPIPVAIPVENATEMIVLLHLVASFWDGAGSD